MLAVSSANRIRKKDDRSSRNNDADGAKFTGSICRVDHYVAGSAGRTHRSQQALQGLGAGLVEAVREQAPDQPARALAEQFSGCRVGL